MGKTVEQQLRQHDVDKKREPYRVKLERRQASALKRKEKAISYLTLKVKRVRALVTRNAEKLKHYEAQLKELNNA